MFAAKSNKKIEKRLLQLTSDDLDIVLGHVGQAFATYNFSHKLLIMSFQPPVPSNDAGYPDILEH